jgi:hypothetical protein
MYEYMPGAYQGGKQEKWHLTRSVAPIQATECIHARGPNLNEYRKQAGAKEAPPSSSCLVGRRRRRAAQHAATAFGRRSADAAEGRSRPNRPCRANGRARSDGPLIGAGVDTSDGLRPCAAVAADLAAIEALELLRAALAVAELQLASARRLHTCGLREGSREAGAGGW